jgi:hypothetical protein
LELDHRVFLNLHTLKFYCLPDDYEIIDSALDDIKVRIPRVYIFVIFFTQYVLRPTFRAEDVAKLDKQSGLVRAQDGGTYHPGVMGLNNIKANDYCNCVLQVSILLFVWFDLLYSFRHFLPFHRFVTISCVKRTIRVLSDHQVCNTMLWKFSNVSLPF